jgi:hypothetical protein
MKPILQCFIAVFFFSLHPSYGQLTQVSRMLYQESSLVINADSSSSSVMVCDLFEDKPGHLSPVIGTGSWREANKPVNLRSQLFFSLANLADIKPGDIIKAFLILVPARTGNADLEEVSCRIRVRRIIQPWVDSLTTWRNQPEVSTTDDNSYLLPPANISTYYKLNVTKMLRNMLKYGNFGFQLCFDEYAGNSFSRFFYSAREEKQELRPQLVVTVASDILTVRYPIAYREFYPDENRWAFPMADPKGTAPRITMEPVKPAEPSPPPAPVKDKTDNRP